MGSSRLRGALPAVGDDPSGADGQRKDEKRGEDQVAGDEVANGEKGAARKRDFRLRMLSSPPFSLGRGRVLEYAETRYRDASNEKADQQGCSNCHLGTANDTVLSGERKRVRCSALLGGAGSLRSGVEEFDDGAPDAHELGNESDDDDYRRGQSQ